MQICNFYQRRTAKIFSRASVSSFLNNASERSLLVKQQSPSVINGDKNTLFQHAITAEVLRRKITCYGSLMPAQLSNEILKCVN